MPYYEFDISAPEESREAVMNKLFEMGSTGFFERDRHIIAYFDEKNNAAAICDELNRFRDVLKVSGLDHAFSFDFNLIPEKDWNETWKTQFEPIDAGDNFTILPPWVEKITNRVNLIIDPGMAFGTGHHETTRTCLELIEKFSKKGKEERFLDIGTGTGILAIAAAKLGFKDIVAVDTDPLAYDAAKRNVELNKIRNVEIKLGDISGAEGKFDFISANLISETLISIAYEIKSRLDANGIVVLSGMLIGQEEDVINAMAEQGLHLVEKFNDGKWVTLIVRKP